MRIATALLAAVCAVAFTGCGTVAPQTRGGRAGLQLSGMVDGRQLAVSDGSPRVVVGNCGPADVASTDVCIISRDLNGQLVVLVLKNPRVLDNGASLDVADADCQDPAACDEVRDVAVVDLQVGGDRQRADDGTLALTTVQEHRRYAGSLRLKLPDGRVSGEFDVVSGAD